MQSLHSFITKVSPSLSFSPFHLSIATVLLHRYAWRDQSIIAAPTPAAAHRVISVLTLVVLFVLYVPIVAQFGVTVRVVTALLIFMLVLFVARPAVDPNGVAGYCGIPVGTRLFAVALVLVRHVYFFF